jgi:hypothetical protein
MSIIDDLKAIFNAPAEIAAAREALSAALTGKVPAGKPDKEKTDDKR